jgi:hypothetical protein
MKDLILSEPQVLQKYRKVFNATSLGKLIKPIWKRSTDKNRRTNKARWG